MKFFLIFLKLTESITQQYFGFVLDPKNGHFKRNGYIFLLESICNIFLAPALNIWGKSGKLKKKSIFLVYFEGALRHVFFPIIEKGCLKSNENNISYISRPFICVIFEKKCVLLLIRNKNDFDLCDLVISFSPI